MLASSCLSFIRPELGYQPQSDVFNRRILVQETPIGTHTIIDALNFDFDPSSIVEGGYSILKNAMKLKNILKPNDSAEPFPETSSE